MAGDFYTDEEVDALCDGLTQNAAKVRHLREVCKLRVDRKPNGRPLAWRPDPAPEQNRPPEPAEPAAVGVGLQRWQAQRRERRGTKAQGR